MTPMWLGCQQDYAQTLDLQLNMLERRLRDEIPDTVLLLEHAPVYTIGRTRDHSSLQTPSHLPYPVFETNRGGQATYHGPGQLVGYPIVNLVPLGRDLHHFLRSLELALIETCASFGVTACQRDGLTGVWVEDRKIASIGVGVKKWVTMHGYAINLARPSLKGFLAITPCGIKDVRMTCLENELPESVALPTSREFGERVTSRLSALLES